MTTKTEGETKQLEGAVEQISTTFDGGVKVNGQWWNYTKPDRRGAWYDPRKGDRVKLTLNAWHKDDGTTKWFVKAIELVESTGAPEASDAPWEEAPETPHRAVTAIVTTDPRDTTLIVRQMSWYAAVQAYALKGQLREGYDTEALFAALKAAAHGIEADILRNE